MSGAKESVFLFFQDLISTKEVISIPQYNNPLGIFESVFLLDPSPFVHLLVDEDCPLLILSCEGKIIATFFYFC